MKIRIVSPIVGDWLIEEALKEGRQFAAPDTELDAVGIKKGPTSIECIYDEVLANPHVVDLVVQAEKDGCDGVFITCFGDPGVDAAREMVDIPVVGGFAPAALMASCLAGQWSVVTVLREIIPLCRDLARKNGLETSMASVRVIDIPVLELSDQDRLQNRTLEESIKAVQEDGAEAIVLGCTAMLGLGDFLRKGFAAQGMSVPVVEPTAAALGFLESMIRSGVSHSKLTFPTPREKERID
jgi:allantoin racemase